MEIPQELKELYNHWEKHTKKRRVDSSCALNQDVLKEIKPFIQKRMGIYNKKEIEQQKRPYTHDPILSQYRFCNIYRELDKQTIVFHKLLKPLTNDFSLWLLNMLFCRLICNPQTIKKIGLLSFNEKQNEQVYRNLSLLESPKYGVAYLFPISMIQKSEYPTRERFFCYYLPKKIKECAKVLDKSKEESIVNLVKRITEAFGFNLKFHWTEVCIDVAYQYPDKINLYKEFPIGPGSAPTMKRLNGREDPNQVCLSLLNEHIVSNSLLQYNGRDVYLSAENWEGVGCEFRKYTNLKNGKGRRRIYR